MDKDSYLENLKDRVLQASFSEWAALLALNGLILTAGSIAAGMKQSCPTLPVLLLFACNIGSSVLILGNMRFLRKSYETAYDQTQKQKPDEDYRRNVLTIRYAARRKNHRRLLVLADALLIFSLLILLHLLILL